MKKFLLLAALLGGTSLAATAAPSTTTPTAPVTTTTAVNAKVGVKTKHVNLLMCGDFTMCGQAVTVCGSTPQERVAVYNYAYDCCCGDGTVLV